MMIYDVTGGDAMCHMVLVFVHRKSEGNLSTLRPLTLQSPMLIRPFSCRKCWITWRSWSVGRSNEGNKVIWHVTKHHDEVMMKLYKLYKLYGEDVRTSCATVGILRNAAPRSTQHHWFSFSHLARIQCPTSSVLRSSDSACFMGWKHVKDILKQIHRMNMDEHGWTWMNKSTDIADGVTSWYKLIQVAESAGLEWPKSLSPSLWGSCLSTLRLHHCDCSRCYFCMDRSWQVALHCICPRFIPLSSLYKSTNMGLSENSVALNPMVLLIIIPTNGYNWGVYPIFRHTHIWETKRCTCPNLSESLQARAGSKGAEHDRQSPTEWRRDPWRKPLKFSANIWVWINTY